jgi:uncharacterized membrane protein
MESADSSQRQKRRLRLALSQEFHGVTRLEAFSDAIFAIAATLLVLDLKVPRGLSSSSQLSEALARQWPVYLSYVLSFLFIGIYWGSHYSMLRHFKRTDHLLLKINILFLMVIAILPFPTALLAEYWHSSPEQRLMAALIFQACLFLTATLYCAIWLYAVKKRDLLDESVDEATIKATTIKNLISPGFQAIAFVVSFWSPTAGLFIVLMIALFYLLPVQIVRFD